MRERGKRPRAEARTGSARWWRRAAIDVALRMAAFVWLVVILATGQADHHYFWLAVAGAVLTGLLLVPRVIACWLALSRPGYLD